MINIRLFDAQQHDGDSDARASRYKHSLFTHILKTNQYGRPIQSINLLRNYSSIFKQLTALLSNCSH
jgi:hypothetical protein